MNINDAWPIVGRSQKNPLLLVMVIFHIYRKKPGISWYPSSRWSFSPSAEQYIYHTPHSYNSCAPQLSGLPLVAIVTIVMNHWLVVYLPLWKNISQLGWLFPIYGKIKAMFQTTNQIILLVVISPFLYIPMDKYHILYIIWIIYQVYHSQSWAGLDTWWCRAWLSLAGPGNKKKKEEGF